MSPQRKAMLISQAIKTFRLINKEKAYKGKECQTEEGEEGGDSNCVSQREGMWETKHQLRVH